MCGIFAYTGTKRDASAAVTEGLKRLDYRGYDSWGIAALVSDGFATTRHVGVVDPARADLPHSTVAIGHTRWATHGSVSEKNAHPHAASDESFTLAHNGIVENYAELKAQLQAKGYEFKTETDTEVIVRLLEEIRRREKNLMTAVRRTFAQLAGRNTIILLARDGTIIAARNGSPLVIGRNTNGEIYLSSDVLSFAPHVKEVCVVDNGTLVEIVGTEIRLMKVGGGTLRPRFEKNAIVGSEVSKGAYEHFMLKEIHDSPAVIRQTMKVSTKDIQKLASAVRAARNVYCIGSGTAGAAAAQIAFYLRTIARVPAVALIGAEASDYYGLFGRGDLFIAPSQSGETADVLEVLEYAKKKGAKIASHVNMPGSYMTRISDFPFMAQAGPEICVMSTKIFVSQIAWGFRLAHAVARKDAQGVRALGKLAKVMSALLADASFHTQIRDRARAYASGEHLFLLAKGQNVQIMREAMVKIIEGAYVHAHGIPAGDLKHYAITLMQPGTPVIALLSHDGLERDVENAIHEVEARGALVTVVGSSDKEYANMLALPDTQATSAIMNIIPLQLLAYYMAVARGNNVDKPRNIAKSVTVK